jgi:Ankyrin repeats (3 copies)/Domain of unknown function (DUF4375)
MMSTLIQQTMAAIRERTFGEFQALLAQDAQLIEQCGVLMLEHAAEYDRIDVLEFLVAAGVDINGSSHMDTPLSSAAKNASVAMVQWPLDHGADINGRAVNRGSTPLHSAIADGRLDMVEFLLDHGADPDILEGNPQRNALAAARFWQEADIVAFLEGRGIAEIVIEPEPVDVESEQFLVETEPLGVMEWFEGKWGAVYAYGVKHGLAAMCEKNQVFFLVGYLINELANGGTEMVYFNPSAEYAPEMPAALEKIGATEAAEVIRDINARFPGGAPANEVQERAAQLHSTGPAINTRGERLEVIFDECVPNGGDSKLVVQLYDYWHA